MKIKIISILFISSVLFCIAQDVLLLPFDATSLTEAQKNLNPDYRAYPTALEDSMPTIICNDDLLDCMEAVDLGLSVKWATCNIGAGSPEDYGDYFAWGETQPKDVYDWSTYKWCNGSYNTQTKYCTSNNYGIVDNKTILETIDDAATVNLGANWRMPTKEEQDELRDRCTWIWVTQRGVNGYKVVGRNGKSIFLPAAGFYNDSSLNLAGSRGYYWSSTTYINFSYTAYYLLFLSDYVERNYFHRYHGHSIRPVCP